MEIIGWITLDKNNMERFFKGEEMPKISGEYTYIRYNNETGDCDYGEELPEGTIKAIYGKRAHWHYGESRFAVYA